MGKSKIENLVGSPITGEWQAVCKSCNFVSKSGSMNYADRTADTHVKATQHTVDIVKIETCESCQKQFAEGTLLECEFCNEKLCNNCIERICTSNPCNL